MSESCCGLIRVKVLQMAQLKSRRFIRDWIEGLGSVKFD